MVGKSTLCAKLSEDPRFRHIALGGFIRKNERYREEIAAHLSRGELIPTEMSLAILGEALALVEADIIYLIDGFPRSLNCLDMWRSMDREDPEIVLHLSARTSTLYARRVVREEIECRGDDRRDIFEKRLEVYKNETMPVLQMLKSVVRIDANGDVGYMVQEAMNCLGLGGGV